MGMKELARQTRTRFGLQTPRVLRSDLRRIYKAEGIAIDLWPHRLKKLRGAYFDDDIGPTVMLAKGLPEGPMVFTMAHELKHHLADRGRPLSYCDASNESDPIEIGAEVFAAELIYPEEDFTKDLAQQGVFKGRCTANSLIKLKHDTRTTLSYTGQRERSSLVLPLQESLRRSNGRSWKSKSMAFRSTNACLLEKSPERKQSGCSDGPDDRRWHSGTVTVNSYWGMFCSRFEKS
jgi:Zn-dependent peptidase ImmA (M78 family)